MSRIITDNYLDKLDTIIEDFEQSTNLTSLMNFFIEEVQKDKKRIGNSHQKIFNFNDVERLTDLKNSLKFKRIFNYINIIIKEFSGKYLHIHINANLSDNIIQNLLNLFFWNTLGDSNYDKNLLDNELVKLIKETNRELVMPDSNNGHLKNNILKERYGLKHRLKFIEILNNKTIDISKSGILLNLNKSVFDIVNISSYSLFPQALNSHVNFGESIQEIYENNNSILKNINTIINLFPIERGRNIWHNEFLPENINSWNQFTEYNFSKVITITTGEKTNEALLDIQKQRKFQSEEVYIIFSFEL